MITPETGQQLYVPGTEPGTVFKFASLDQLPPFEDSVAQVVDRNMEGRGLVQWQGRPYIQNLMIPKGYGGRFTQIELEVMDEPYTRLVAASKQSRLGRTSLVERTSERGIARQKDYIGFVFRAIAISRQNRVMVEEEAQSALWYVPNSQRRGSTPVQRYIAQTILAPQPKPHA